MKQITLICAFLASFSAFGDCRNPAIKHQFDKAHGFPHGRPGFVVDHVCPLSCGGLDSTANMQYQTHADALSKDRWETTKTGCKLLCNPANSTYPVRRVFNCKD